MQLVAEHQGSLGLQKTALSLICSLTDKSPATVSRILRYMQLVCFNLHSFLEKLSPTISPPEMVCCAANREM